MLPTRPVRRSGSASFLVGHLAYIVGLLVAGPRARCRWRWAWSWSSVHGRAGRRPARARCGRRPRPRARRARPGLHAAYLADGRVRASGSVVPARHRRRRALLRCPTPRIGWSRFVPRPSRGHRLVIITTYHARRSSASSCRSSQSLTAGPLGPAQASAGEAAVGERARATTDPRGRSAARRVCSVQRCSRARRRGGPPGGCRPRARRSRSRCRGSPWASRSRRPTARGWRTPVAMGVAGRHQSAAGLAAPRASRKRLAIGAGHAEGQVRRRDGSRCDAGGARTTIAGPCASASAIARPARRGPRRGADVDPGDRRVDQHQPQPRARRRPGGRRSAGAGPWRRHGVGGSTSRSRLDLVVAAGSGLDGHRQSAEQSADQRPTSAARPASTMSPFTTRCSAPHAVPSANAARVHRTRWGASTSAVSDGAAQAEVLAAEVQVADRREPVAARRTGRPGAVPCGSCRPPACRP